MSSRRELLQRQREREQQRRVQQRELEQIERARAERDRRSAAFSPPPGAMLQQSFGQGFSTFADESPGRAQFAQFARRPSGEFASHPSNLWQRPSDTNMDEGTMKRTPPMDACQSLAHAVRVEHHRALSDAQGTHADCLRAVDRELSNWLAERQTGHDERSGELREVSAPLVAWSVAPTSQHTGNAVRVEVPSSFPPKFPIWTIDRSNNSEHRSRGSLPEHVSIGPKPLSRHSSRP